MVTIRTVAIHVSDAAGHPRDNCPLSWLTANLRYGNPIARLIRNLAYVTPAVQFTGFLSDTLTGFCRTVCNSAHEMFAILPMSTNDDTNPE